MHTGLAIFIIFVSERAIIAESYDNWGRRPTFKLTGHGGVQVLSVDGPTLRGRDERQLLHETLLADRTQRRFDINTPASLGDLVYGICRTDSDRSIRKR